MKKVAYRGIQALEGYKARPDGKAFSEWYGNVGNRFEWVNDAAVADVVLSFNQSVMDPVGDDAVHIGIIMEPFPIASAAYREVWTRPERFAHVYGMAAPPGPASGFSRMYYPHPAEIVPQSTKRKGLCMVVSHRANIRLPMVNRRTRQFLQYAKRVPAALYGYGWENRMPQGARLLSTLGSHGYWQYKKLRQYWAPDDRPKEALLAGHRVNLCMENYVDPWYTSEKLLDAVITGTLPIYEGGDQTIMKLLQKVRSRYGDWHEPWMLQRLMDQPEELQGAVTDVREGLIDAGVLARHHSMLDTVLDRMIEESYN